ncbi:helix-turn-helix domain-containing protein [Streptomyces sp. NPDC014685]|uniref:helix-turn-helix domain-containing protein n=1 Tax=Streptomyces sp. NPDC014685 TaxID=3364881 RepID=UPI0036F75C60
MTVRDYRGGNTLVDAPVRRLRVHKIAPEASPMDAATPGLLSPDVLDRADVRAALIEHDFAAVFTLIKKWGGLSQNRIASACQLTPGKVSTIISGSQRVTSFEVICRIADGLRIPGALLGLASRPWEHQQHTEQQRSPETLSERPTDEIPWRPDATVSLATDLIRSDLMMDRRALTRAGRSRSHWCHPARPPRRVARSSFYPLGPAPTRTAWYPRPRGIGGHGAGVSSVGPPVRRRPAPKGGGRTACRGIRSP